MNGKKVKLFIALIGFVAAALFIFFVLQNEKNLLVHPKGIMARGELNLIITQISLMLIIIIPTLIIFFWVAWKYRESNSKTSVEDIHAKSSFKQILLWILPSIVIAVMIVVLWRATHELDPYKPLQSDLEPLHIQVVAMEWKWLFIYPEQKIASVNCSR